MSSTSAAYETSSEEYLLDITEDHSLGERLLADFGYTRFSQKPDPQNPGWSDYLLTGPVLAHRLHQNFLAGAVGNPPVWTPQEIEDARSHPERELPITKEG